MGRGFLRAVTKLNCGEKDRVDGKERGVLSREEGKMCPLKAKVPQKGD